jgi:hypothetical protein
MMLFWWGNRKKSTQRTPLIWHLQAQDQGSMVDFFLFPRLKSIMKGACFADVVRRTIYSSLSIQSETQLCCSL